MLNHKFTGTKLCMINILGNGIQLHDHYEMNCLLFNPFHFLCIIVILNAFATLFGEINCYKYI